MGPVNGHEGAVEEARPETKQQEFYQGNQVGQPDPAAETPALPIAGGANNFSGQTAGQQMGRPPKLSQREKDRLELDNIYTHHTPHGDQVNRYLHLREMAKLLADSILQSCPPSRERALALTNVQTASMFANQAIAIHEVAPVAPAENASSVEPADPAERRIAQIAKACHEANRNYCRSLGDFTQHPWEEAEPWQQISAMNGVRQILNNPLTTPEQSHENWMREKLADGWAFGVVKDPVAKLHPCLVAYDLLPAEQRAKDAIFGAVARAVAGI